MRPTTSKVLLVRRTRSRRRETLRSRQSSVLSEVNTLSVICLNGVDILTISLPIIFISSCTHPRMHTMYSKNAILKSKMKRMKFSGERSVLNNVLWRWKDRSPPKHTASYYRASQNAYKKIGLHFCCLKFDSDRPSRNLTLTIVGIVNWAQCLNCFL